MEHLFQSKNQTYESWDIIPPLNECDFKPGYHKLFHNDIFYFDNQKNIVNIKKSPIREKKYIAGILQLNKTYGKEKNKFLYLCIPYNKKIPRFLIPYQKKYSFDKTEYNLYITFTFKHWDYEHPYGIIHQNLGDTSISVHYYEYMLYAEELHESLKKFQHSLKDKIKKQNDLLTEICNYYHIPTKKDDFCFSIDSKTTNDYDDAFSIQDDIIKIYISGVSIVVDYLNIYTDFTSRPSTIYMPDKKWSMIPALLSEDFCSLTEKSCSLCFVMEFKYINNELLFQSSYLQNTFIHKNFIYEEENLCNNKDYIELKKIIQKINPFAYTSYNIVEFLMILFNKEATKMLEKNKIGIYKHNVLHEKKNYENIPNELNHFLRYYKTISSSYEIYEKQTYYSSTDEDIKCYAQFTSPLRRMGDLINILHYIQCMKLCKLKNMESFENLSNNWVNNLESINETMKKIKKVQRKCELLSLFEQHDSNTKYEAYIFDGILNEKKNWKYTLYIPQIKGVFFVKSKEKYTDFTKKMIRLFLFKSEENIHQKIKFKI